MGGTWARRRKDLVKAIRSVDPNTADALMIRSNVLWLDDPHGTKPETLSKLQEFLELQKTALKNEKHPDILENIFAVAYYRSFNGDYKDATTYIKIAVEGRTLVLGFDHPSTVSSQNAMAHNLDDLGKPDVQMFKTAAEQMAKISLTTYEH